MVVPALCPSGSFSAHTLALSISTEDSYSGPPSCLAPPCLEVSNRAKDFRQDKRFVLLQLKVFPAATSLFDRGDGPRESARERTGARLCAPQSVRAEVGAGPVEWSIPPGPGPAAWRAPPARRGQPGAGLRHAPTATPPHRAAAGRGRPGSSGRGYRNC